MLKRSLDWLQTLRNSYDEVKAKAVSLAQVWGVSHECTQRRVSTVPRQIDKKEIDQQLTDPEQRFNLSVFYSSIIISQLQQRFNGVNFIATKFQCLSPHFLLSDTATDKILFEAATSLSNGYLEDLSSDFSNQMLSFRVLFREAIKQVRSVFDLADMLIIKS